MNALAHGADEGRKASENHVDLHKETKRGYPNGETRMRKTHTPLSEYIA